MTAPDEKPKQLPLFEGKRPPLAAISITGSTEKDARFSEVLHVDQDVILVCRARVASIAHGLNGDDQLVRKQTVKVHAAFALDAGDIDAHAFVEWLADREARIEEETTGQQRLGQDQADDDSTPEPPAAAEDGD